MNPLTRNEYRASQVNMQRAETHSFRTTLPVFTPYRAKLRFLEALKASPVLSAKLAASRLASDLMDRIASSRFDNAIAKGKGYGANAGQYVEPYVSGSMDVPLAYASRVESEQSASPETLDTETVYAIA